MPDSVGERREVENVGCYEIFCPEAQKGSCKIEVRHVLFKEIYFLIFLK